MKCLRKYQWVKLPRDIPDMGKGLMAYWAMLAFRAAFRKGNASYCGHSNPVAPGMWAGGVVGLKSILGVRSRTKALQILGELSSLGFLKYSLDSQTKKLTYEITDWVVKCSGAECMSGTVYASTGYGFLCLPRNITQRLANAKRVFDEADAWLDLWCHTTYEDYGNAFSFLAPVVQYGRFGSVLTLETLGERWGWEKTKVWRFFKKHGDVFSLYRLPSSYGCLVFNASYPTGADIQLPEQEIVMRILRKILICSAYKCKGGSENLRVNHMVAWYSRAVILSQQMQDCLGKYHLCHHSQITLKEGILMTQCELPKEELVRRKELSDNTRKMIYSLLDVAAEDETSLMTTYRDFYLQISFSELHPLMVFYLARPLDGEKAMLADRSNEMNLRSVLGSHSVNENFSCYNYRATHWLDAQMTKTRFFEILDRCVDEAVRGYYQLAH